MRNILLVCILGLLTAASFGSAQSAIATDAKTASGGLPPVYDQITLPSRSGGGPPGATEIQYDRPPLANAWYFWEKRSKYAMRMDPPYHPAVVAQCDIHVLTNGDPYWPWPESHHDSIYIEAWFDRNGDGLPDFPEAWGAWGRATSTLPDTATITVRPPMGSVVCQTGSFWVGMMMDTLWEHPGAGSEGVAIDAHADYPDNQFYYWAPKGAWRQGVYAYNGDFMFRAWVTPDSTPYFFGAVVLLPNQGMDITVGDTLLPCAQVTNFSIAAESTWVWMKIQDACSTDNYIDSSWVRLGSLQVLDTAFRRWTPLYPGGYRVRCASLRNGADWSHFTVSPRVGLGEGRLPLSLTLNGIEVGPNPIRSGSAIRYHVVGKSRVVLRILDTRGRVVRTFATGCLSPGEHTAIWDARDDQGILAPRGIYFVRLESQDCRETRKVILAR
jgi:hypothetical protein